MDFYGQENSVKTTRAPVLQHGDRENRVELRDMFFQAGEDLLVHGACITHAYALSSHLG